MIHQLDFNGIDKVEKAIKRLQLYEPPEGYYLCFSGGKDSVVIKALADMAGVKYDAHYNVTSVDPPELVRFIKREYPEVEFEYHYDKNGKRITMWSLIASKQMPPTRFTRYCCAYLKESGGGGRLKITGVRWAESTRRKYSHGEVTIMRGSAKEIAEQEYTDIAYKVTPQGGIALPLDNRENAKMVETCYRTRQTTVNPIIDWTDAEVWEFIHEYNVPYCELYDQGYKRLGCIGCPMVDNKAGLEAYPKYKALYLKAFERMLESNRQKGIVSKAKWDTAEDVMEWWINNGKIQDTDTEIMGLIDE
jgi:phosphoadenosine phosphosulfate reductase